MKPQLILHIGMPKAGSSALQGTLGLSAKALARHGILYPAGGGLPKNHNMLVGGFEREDRLPRLLRQAYADEPALIRGDLEAFLEKIAQAISQAQPQRVVLSGEMLFRPLGANKAAKLSALLAPLSDDIRVLAYVRSPAPFYLSWLQQRIKASSRIAPPAPAAYRRVLESYRQITSAVEVFAFDRAQLRGGDITCDFLHRVAPEREIAADELILQNSNTSLSAEGMDILHKYRKFNHGEIDGTFTQDTREVTKRIAEVDVETGSSRPALLEDVRRYLETSCVDLLWLRDTHGVVFGDVDYGEIVMDAPPPSTPKRIGDVRVLDEDRRDRMIAILLRRLAGGSETKTDMNFRAVLSKRRRKKSAKP